MPTDYSYIGKGVLHLRVAGASAGLLAVGNCSELKFSMTEETKELLDYTNAGGGDYNSVSRLSGVTASMKLHDISPANLAKAARGDSTAIAAGTVTDEAVGNAYAGGMLVTDFPIDTDVAPVVEHAQNAATARANSTAYALGDYYLPAAPNGYVYKVTVAGTSDASPPTFPTTVGDTVADGTATVRNVGSALLVVTDDYTVSGGGIKIAETGAEIYDGEAVIVSYTKKAGDSVEALLNSAQEYELYFDGLNEARSGKAVTVHAFRVKLSPAAELSLIGDDYAALDLSGQVLKDTTKDGVSASQYFRAQVVA